MPPKRASDVSIDPSKSTERLRRQKRHGPRTYFAGAQQYAVGDVLVILAAVATAPTASPWPDFAVGVIMSLLFVSGSWAVYTQARHESAAFAAR
jgi:Co/Zn/Cd efflux system component